ncbi:hypothetical protein [Gimesia chilikensis]|jgi:hypothetical protein|uniref:Nudix hydrolase domain-containing protein n=1 Tax=Gimesia chilikensis TaxID=2605989 RepID=A0A517PNH1_9PLAN|nr:hypothetical protein [Gimesia chilikensis]MCR9232567.1 hypothetical protein [bacterium]QDT20912.1 hypothetical protein HG66A1_27030 [Gimesia chilikensis]QDT84698.1 hypothetical protein MalM14_23600 [Gimesia chilikensis]
MSNFVGAFILFQTTIEGKPHWLVHWNYERQEFMLPGERKRPYETFQHCLISELEKSFELAPFEDFIIAREPLAHLAFTLKPDADNTSEHYIVELFDFQELNSSAREQLEKDLRNRWVNELEIEASSTNDDFPISELLGTLYHKANLANRLS